MKRVILPLLAAVLFAAGACGKTQAPSAQTETTAQTASVSAAETSAASEPAEESTHAPSAAAPQPSQTPPTAAAPEPTQLPLTTTQPSQTQAQPTEGAIPFTAEAIRTYGYSDIAAGYPETKVFASREALDDYLQEFLRTVHTPTLPQDIADAAAKYTAQWFADNRLILVIAQENSGSIRHTVRQVRRTPSGVTIEIDRTCPQIRTMDMAEWHIFIEIADTSVTPDTNIDLALHTIDL